MTTPDPYWRMKELFASALEKPPSNRDVYLESACDDPTLREQIRALLGAHEQASALIAIPQAPGPPTSPPQTTSERPGDVIGPYKLLQRIGEGGFGTVYMA
ncbi:MAG: serine/threonine protein kinase, partial [Tepidisphaeraceae bacterium]